MLATRRTAAPAAAALFALLALTGCSAGSSDDSSSSGAGGSSADMAAPAQREVASDDDGGSAASVADLAQAPPAEQLVISTGTVELRADDVEEAVVGVRAVVDRYAGELGEDSARTDDDGEPSSARLVVRVRTTSFDQAMADLKEIGTLVAADSGTDDVTTQVVDTDVRVEAQRRSIERIQVLFDQATSIKDIVSIERELSNRQADLASLEQQQAYLADQTAQATITVSVERARSGATDDDSGFLAGLGAGWAGLSAFTVGLVTVAGAVLPFAVVLLVLGALAWPLVRRSRRRRPATG